MLFLLDMWRKGDDDDLAKTDEVFSEDLKSQRMCVRPASTVTEGA